MTIQYIPPLRRAWQRMVEQLFHPFDLSKWIILGFTCWLVRLLRGGGGGGVSIPPPGGGSGSYDFSNFDPSSWWDRLFHGVGVGLLVAGIGCVILVILALVLVVMWISSRGHFLFLDNVVRDRAQVVEPWNEYRREGNSLFVWRLVFSLVCALSILLLAVPGVWLLVSAASAESTRGIVGGLAALLVPVLLAAVTLAFIDLFLTDFVVPIMYQRRLKTTEAWRVFLPRLRQNLVEFLLYGFFVLGLHIAVGLVITAVGFATCCMAFLILALPVVGTVILLPLHLTYRIYSLEFLGQLGPDYQLLPPGEPPSESVPAISAG